jgi:2-polyprenyl-3-methyl-5-hydroxy-6-metoxy-1,4-benzoquinol methylase
MEETRDDWYDGFQSGLMARFWHLASDPSGDDEADAIASLLELPAGARVLDAPCGAGRIAIRLAERGFDVTGIDISEHEVEEARRRAANRGTEVEFERADVRRPPPGPFDAVVIWGNSFGYMPHPDTVEHISACRRVLREGGRLILETGTAAEVLLPELRQRMDYDMGELIMSGVNSYDPARGRLVTEIELRTPDGGVERGAVAHHVFTASEIIRMLESAGFRVSELLGDPAERSAFEVGSHRLIVLATAV